MIPKPGGLSPKQNPSLTNWWWSRTMSLLSLSLNTCRFTALDLSLPYCFSAELEQPRTCLFSMKTGFLSCCSLPCGKAAATHLAHSPLDIQYAGTAQSLQGTEMSRWQICRERCGDGTQRGQQLPHHILELGVV